MKRFGIDVTFVDCNASDEELHAAFRENTRAVFGETISNPSIASSVRPSLIAAHPIR